MLHLLSYNGLSACCQGATFLLLQYEIGYR